MENKRQIGGVPLGEDKPKSCVLYQKSKTLLSVLNRQGGEPKSGAFGEGQRCLSGSTATRDMRDWGFNVPADITRERHSL